MRNDPNSEREATISAGTADSAAGQMAASARAAQPRTSPSSSIRQSISAGTAARAPGPIAAKASATPARAQASSLAGGNVRIGQSGNSDQVQKLLFLLFELPPGD
jgi:hypothetical protein